MAKNQMGIVAGAMGAPMLKGVTPLGRKMGVSTGVSKPGYVSSLGRKLEVSTGYEPVAPTRALPVPKPIGSMTGKL